MNPVKFSQTVLIVDDEIFILRTTATILENHGFKYIQTARTVPEAIDYITDCEPPVNLVLIDLNMPDQDGLDLLRCLDEMAYQDAIVLFSGEDDQTLKMAERLAWERHLHVLGAVGKPVQALELLGLLENYHVFRPQKQSSCNDEAFVTVQMLERAIENQEIVPWFQPKVDVRSLEPVATEALARWYDSKKGFIAPYVFIPVAEEYNLIDELTFSIVKQVARIANQLSSQGIHLKMSVNLSMLSLNNPGFVNYLESYIRQAGGELSQFIFEVTETQLMSSVVNPLEALLRLRMKKAKLSIDDFGTGHSNLSQLIDLPFDEIKLDRSYVRINEFDDRSSIVLQSAISMARKLEMSIIAEGVETLEEWHRVTGLGCDQVQGYLIAKPMPAKEIVSWMAQWNKQRFKLFGV